MWIYCGCVNVSVSDIYMGGEREDLGFLVKVWGGFCAACSESEGNVLCGL